MSGQTRSTGVAAEPAGGLVVRRAPRGWRVGDEEEVTDLTSAMVLADLLAAELGAPAPPPACAAVRAGQRGGRGRAACRDGRAA